MLEQAIKYSKLFKFLLGGIEGSISLLQEIHAKLDVQATSKLYGQLRSLQRHYQAGKPDKTTLRIALSSLTESSEYFKSMAEQTFSTLKKLTSAIVSWEWITFGVFTSHGRVIKCLNVYTELVNYVNFLCLSKIGMIVCMKELEYPRKSIIEELRKLDEEMTVICEEIDSSSPLATLTAALLRLAERKNLLRERVLGGSVFEELSLPARLFTKTVLTGKFVRRNTLIEWVRGYSLMFRLAALCRLLFSRKVDPDDFIDYLGRLDEGRP